MEVTERCSVNPGLLNLILNNLQLLVLKYSPPNVFTCNFSVPTGLNFSLEYNCSVTYDQWLPLSKRIQTMEEEPVSWL